ncbi:MAG: hypothetical protein D6727_12005 [Gammaproteobacteria bacterium]|nr:MAG: hypothetical protein D6727_12005 [Gammaproteobacteria bacterium]
MSKLFEMPLVLGTVAFLAGYVLAKLGALLSRKAPEAPPPSDRDKRLRSLDAELRVVRKKLEEAEAAVRDREMQNGELRAELDELRERIGDANEETESLRLQLRDECEKTQQLRTELSQRAEDEIRAQMRLREIETELSLVHAGNDAVQDEIQRLEAERDELMRRLQAQSPGAAQKRDDDLAVS